jgi:hypothetical protein
LTAVIIFFFYFIIFLNDPSGKPETRRFGAAGTKRTYKVRSGCLGEGGGSCRGG